jgi:SAM-dependent methyltransferase
MSGEFEEHANQIKSRYENRLQQNASDEPEAVHWVSKDRVQLRYDVLTDIGDISETTILDFGCGTALFLDYLEEQGINCDYHGWDISEEMITTARNRHPDAAFNYIDVLNEDISEYEDNFDYIFISGVFHIKTSGDIDTHRKWMYSILEEIWPLCTEGISVNFMTEHVDWEDNDLYYCDISTLIDFCVDTFNRWYTIRSDYDLWEHTLYVYNEPQMKP